MLKQTHPIEINEKECDDDNEDGDEEQSGGGRIFIYCVKSWYSLIYNTYHGKDGDER